MSETIEDVVKRLRDCAEARRRSGKLLQIDDRMFDLIADEIEEAVKNQFRDTTKTMPHLREVTKMEEVAVAENATTTPTCDKYSQVGNAAATRKALERLREWALMDLNENAFIADSSGNYMKLIKGTIEIANAALAKPPRNCDIMSLNTARKEWFAKEILPRLDGKLPLGKEKPFDEWFVSQHEEGEQK